LFKLIYTNSRGRSIELFGSPFRLTRVEGLGGTQAGLQMQASPYQDGYTYLDSVLEDKPMEIEFKITGSNVEEITNYRRHVASIFNPKLGLGLLEHVSENGTREIKAVPESVPFFPDGRTNRGRTFQKALINLRAPYPYWQSPLKTTEPLAAFMPKFQFPFKFPVQFGERGSEALLINNGDVPTPIEIEFNGPATQPVVANETTGEFIRLRRELAAGEKLIINTAFGQDRRVVIDTGSSLQNAWHYIDIWESTLFHLDVGENRLTYDAIASGGQAVVNITYQDQFVGV